MADLPLVSVLIPVYNGERYLAESIGSALAQGYRPLEIVVMDDGSTDGTRSIAQSFGASLRYEPQTRAGIGAARNRAVELACGPYLAFLDADDLWIENKIELQMDFFLHDPSLDAVFAHVRHFHSPELPDEVKNKTHCPPGAMPGYYATTMMIARAAFARVGRFETGWQVGEFIDWYARAVQLGLKSALAPEVLALRRLHAGNQSLVERSAQSDYLRVVKASLDRRRKRKRDRAGVRDDS